MNDPKQRHHATEDRKRAIAAATRALIVQKGFEGLRTREIAERVGINIATLHYHVPTKEALIDLVAQSMREDFMARRDLHPSGDLPPRERLELEIDNHRDTLRNNPELLLVMEEMGRRARHDPAIARYIQPMREHWRQQILDILEAGVTDGSFRADLVPQSAVYMVIGTMMATSIYGLADDASLDGAKQALVTSILSDPVKEGTDV